MKSIAYVTKIYNAMRASLYGIVIYAAIMFLIISGGIYVHQPILGVIIYVIFNSTIFIFQKQYKQIFTRDVLIESNDKAFSIKEYNRKNILIKTHLFNWTDIKAYKCYFSQTNITFLTIYLRNKTYKAFLFKDDKDQTKAINEKSVFSIFYYFVNQYNSSKNAKDIILIEEGFLNTKKGIFIIYSLVLLATLNITINIIYKPKASLPLILMSVFIVIGLFVKRSKDKNLYKTISQQKNQSPFD